MTGNQQLMHDPASARKLLFLSSGGYTMNARRGFTLVEITIALLVISIVAVIASSNFQGWIYHSRYSGFLRDVFSEFQQGRQRTIASGIAHTVVVDAAANTVRLRRTSDNVYVRNTLTAPAGSDIASGSSVTFNANGSATSNGNVRIVNLHQAADNQMITVTLGTGRIKIQ
jgi:prepilin-type N-terminal cleavage/methylation domain-containing protein